MKNLFFCFFLVYLTYSHDCIHNKLQAEAVKTAEGYIIDGPQQYQTVKKEDGSYERKLSATSYEKIRIVADYTLLENNNDPQACSTTSPTYQQEGTVSSCLNDHRITDAKLFFVKNTLVPRAINFFKNVVSTIPLTSPLQLSPNPNTNDFQLCRESKIYGAGGVLPTGVPNADFLLVVSMRPAQSSVLAWALYCARENTYGRPVVGHVNFNPLSLKPNDNIDDQFYTAIHEIFHAFAFSSSLYYYYIDPATNQRLNNVVSTYTEHGHTVQKIKTRKVMEEAGNHFGCDAWNNMGIELEDGGSSGSAGSHWEKRLFMNEFMTATSSTLSKVSRVSLALLEDSGWYKVDYSYAEDFKWGYKQGCDFLNKQCPFLDSAHFCKTKDAVLCTVDRLAIGKCVHSSTSPSFTYFNYQQFSFANGNDLYADYCPYIVPYSNTKCSDSKAPKFNSYQYNGGDSRCYEPKDGSRSQTTCFQTACMVDIAGKKYVEVKIDGIKHECKSKSQTFDEYKCPDPEFLCPEYICPSDCNNHGSCVQGVCKCDQTYNGNACQYMDCPKHNDVECNGKGSCDMMTGVCNCEVGYSGDSCNVYQCSGNCNGHGICDTGTGICACFSGYMGDACDQYECAIGAIITNECNGDGSPSTYGECHRISGVCMCNSSVSNTYRHGVACENLASGRSTAYDTNDYVFPETLNITNTTPYNYFLISKSVPANQTYYFIGYFSNAFDAKVIVNTSSTDKFYFYGGVSYPPQKTPDWIGQNHSYTVNGNTVNEMEIQLCGSFGSNDCLYPDTTFLNVDVSTPIIFAVISKTAITIDIRTETQKCANLNCANGLCNENIGCDCTGTDFTGILCEKPLCNSLNKCSNNGDCLINPQNGSNVCRCYSGYIGESCNITSGDTTKVLDLPGFGANSSEMNFTGLSAGPSEFSYQNLSRSDFMTESVIIILKKDPAKPKSDPILSILPQSASEVSISNILMYDKNSWIEYSDIHTMILHCDIFSEGDIRVGVNDGPYSEESVLQYSLSMQVLSGAACPVQLNNCNGQGTCNVNNCPNPICVCNDGYFGYDCSMKYYTFNLLATGATNESISVGGWKFFKVKLQNTISQVVFKLKNYDPMVSVIMLVHTTTFPRLDSLSAQYHFSAMKNRSQDQTVEFFKTSIAAPFKTEYYISIYSMRDNMRDSDFEFSYTTDTTIRSTYRCHEDSDAEQTTPCYCSAQYSGSLCKTPVLNEFSNFLTAAYKIQYLSPNLRETIAYPHKRLLIYKIPQFALGKSEMNVVIEAPSVSNTTLCPTTMLISIRPPRSIYDFTYLSTNTEFNKNSIAISEESVSGKYWIAIISEEQCEYILYTERGPIAYPKASDESFVSGITQWVKENPALIGVVVAIIVIIIVVAAFALYKSHKTESTKQQDMYYTGNSTPANKIISTLDRDSFRLSHTTEKPANLTLNPNIVVCQFCKTQTPRGVRCVTCGRKIINSRNY